MRFNPVNLVGLTLLVLALLCAWRARIDLATGTTQWLAWGRLAAPVVRGDSPVRYWFAMIANIAVVILFALAGVIAFRAGLLRLVVR